MKNQSQKKGDTFGVSEEKQQQDVKSTIAVKKEGDKEEDKGDQVKFQVDLRPKYDLFDEVWFYLPNSLSLRHGQIVGFFLMWNSKDDDGNEEYTYQIKYFKEMQDSHLKMFVGNVTEAEMAKNKEDIEKQFNEIRKERIDSAVNQADTEIQGAQAQIDFETGRKQEMEQERDRLQNIKKGEEEGK